jgi:uncharacterized protein YcfJ
MNRKLGIVSALLAGSMIFMNAARADDTLFGAVLGGGAGVLVGHAVGGRDGAIVGGALGAVAGAVIAADDDDGRRGRHRAYGRAYAAQPRVVEYAPQTVVVRRPVHYVVRHDDDEGRYRRGRDRYERRHWDHGDRHDHRERHWDHDGHRD